MSEKKQSNQYGDIEKRNGIFCSHSRLFIWIVIIIILIAAVGLVAGLLSRQTSVITSSTPSIINPTTPSGPKYSLLRNSRLPQTLFPLAYTFQLDLDMNKFTINGINIIQINMTTPTNIIIVHAIGMKMLVTPQVARDGNFDSQSINYTVADHGSYVKNSYYYVVLQDNLPLGIYYVKFTYVTSMSTDLYGLYRYQYIRASDRTVM